MGKAVTYERLETMLARAIEGSRRLGLDDVAAEYEAMSPEEYAELKGITIIEDSERKNPSRKPKVIKTSEPLTLKRRKTTMSLSEQLERAHKVMDKIWNQHVDLDDDSDQEDLATASEETCDLLNDYDPDRFPFDVDEEEEEAA